MPQKHSEITPLGFYLLVDIIGRRKKPPYIRGIFPVGRTKWYQGVKDEIYPKPIKHGRLNLWRVEDIEKLVQEIGGNADAG
jgi:prophage regulatory protein